MKNIFYLIILILLLFSCQKKEEAATLETVTEIPQTAPKLKQGNASTKALQIAQVKEEELISKNDFEGVINTWDNFQKDNPGKFEGHISQAKAYLCLGQKGNAFKKLNEAKLFYENKIEKKEENSFVIVRLATIYILLDQKSKGINILRTYSQKFPKLNLFMKSYSKNEYLDYLPCSR